MEKIRIVSFRIKKNRNEQDNSTGSTENDDPDGDMYGTDRELIYNNSEDAEEISSVRKVSEGSHSR